MTEIPEDIRAIAESAIENRIAFDEEVVIRRVARAILAERERAAKVADTHATATVAKPHGVNLVARSIAFLIRNP